MENRPNHILFESKYEKPYSKKEKEPKVENIQEISRIKFGNFPEIYGKGTEKEKPKEKGTNYRCNKEEKPYDENNKMNKCIISHNRRKNNLEEKVSNNLITNNDIPKSKEINNDFNFNYPKNKPLYSHREGKVMEGVEGILSKIKGLFDGRESLKICEFKRLSLDIVSGLTDILKKINQKSPNKSLVNRVCKFIDEISKKDSGIWGLSQY